jgi:AGCS family alanine or glycine:cation symporter
MTFRKLLSLPLLSACLLFLIAPALSLAQDSPPPGGTPQPGSAAEAGVTPSPLPITQQQPEAAERPATGFMGQADRAMGAVNSVIAAFFFFDVIFWDDPRTGTRLPLVVLWLVLGAVYFTIKMGFINFRAFGHAIQVVRGKYSNPDDEGEVTHFQALSAALSATVGLGNIAGVAIAVSLGGPGATFWMIIAGLLGMSSKFAECTLGQMYRETRPDGRIMGGAMFYLSKGLAEKGWARLGKVLAVMFAILCIGGSLGGGNSFQVNQSLNAMQETIPALATYPWVYGLIMTVLVGIVIIGGIRRIAHVTEKIVPLMCGIYVLGALIIILDNAGRVPAAFAAIFTQAFSPDAAYGGLIGAIVVGFQRAAFSNEAGAGSAAIAHSAAKTEYPVREGIVALLEPFIDTVVVCTMTALVIVITGAYNNPAYADLVAANKGAALTSRAMGEHLTWFPYILSACVFLFAYSTMISWSYYGERCWAWMFGDGTSQIYRLLFLVFVFLGSIITAANILDFGDLMILGMAFPNILGVLILSNKVKAALQEYWAKKEAGEFKAYK